MFTFYLQSMLFRHYKDMCVHTRKQKYQEVLFDVSKASAYVQTRLQSEMETAWSWSNTIRTFRKRLEKGREKNINYSVFSFGQQDAEGVAFRRFKCNLVDILAFGV